MPDCAVLQHHVLLYVSVCLNNLSQVFMTGCNAVMWPDVTPATAKAEMSTSEGWYYSIIPTFLLKVVTQACPLCFPSIHVQIRMVFTLYKWSYSGYFNFAGITHDATLSKNTK